MAYGSGHRVPGRSRRAAWQEITLCGPTNLHSGRRGSSNGVAEPTWREERGVADRLFLSPTTAGDVPSENIKLADEQCKKVKP